MTARSLPPLALLAGGLGTRLGALAAGRPKSLVSVGGQPFIAHQLRQCRQQGIARVVICAGHGSAALMSFIGTGAEFGLEIDWSLDGPVPLGTGGALANALPLLGDHFFVLYGDSWLDVSYAAVVEEFRGAGRPGLMTVYRNEGRWGASNVEFSAGRLVRHDKSRTAPQMAHIDYGLSVLSPAAFEGYGGSFDLGELYADLAATGRMAGFEVYRRFYEIGSPAGLAETEAHFRGRAA